MAVKLTDVAQKAGVSVTTVSRVINNHGYLSDKTKHKVFTAMKELNYQPNSLARSLQGKNKIEIKRENNLSMGLTKIKRRSLLTLMP